MLEQIVDRAPLFLLVAARCAGLIFTLPLFSMRTVPRAAKVALAGYMAYFIAPEANLPAYGALGADGAFSLEFVMLAAGETMIGVVTGFYVSVIFAAFSTAGQFFAFQMGFSASEVYDSLSQVENPLMGQFLNLVAMLIFLQTGWLQKLFLYGLAESFQTMDAFRLVAAGEGILRTLLSGLTGLFADALLISLPIMGTLLLITVCTGILSKAAPQMNLLSEGFPVMILTAFALLAVMFPALCDFFERSFGTGLSEIVRMLTAAGGNAS